MGIFGNKASENYTHDLQVFSNIENDTRLFLYQCWYKQTINKFIIKLGQLDMNSDYSVSSWASPMINSSFGVIPTMSLNMPVSIFAYITAGVSLKYLANNRLTLQTAFFDGDPGNFETNPHNLKWHFSKDEGFFNISEIHFKTKSNIMQGKYKLGLFYHSKKFTDPVDNYSEKGNIGFFVMGDQQLTSEKNTIKNGLSMFFQISYTPSQVNYIKSYYSMGLIYRGMFPGMNEDEFTAAFASVRLSDTIPDNSADYYNNETALEITYKKYVTPGIIIQPDFQYIINPGASKLYSSNVTAATIRTILAF
jgi:porin